MIYLYDDRKPRLKTYFLEADRSKYGSIITLGIWNPNKVDTKDFIDSLDDAKCILIHGSYTGMNTSIDSIEDYCLSKNIATVNFSGNNNNGIITMKGDNYGTVVDTDFYVNLIPFLKKYEDEGSIDIHLLIYGNDYLKNKIIHTQERIGLRLFNYTMYDNIMAEAKLLIQDLDILNSPELKLSKENIVNFIQDHESKGEPIKKETLINKLSNIKTA